MPLSYQNYTGDNVTTTFNIPFTYTATSEISVTVDGVAQTGLTFPSASEVQLTSAPASGTVVQVRRTTDLTSRAVDFASGSVLTEEDLDNANIQIFHSSQEAVDLTDDTIQEDVDSKWDAENKVIKNVANPVSAQDAATKDYLENTWLTAADKAQLNSLNTTNLNTVATNIADVNAVAADATDIGTVSTNIASVNTVATNIADVITVANDLNEAISEIETAADDLNEAVSDIDTVSTNIANVNTVGGAISNVNTVATNIGNVNTVGGNITNVNTVAGISGNVTTVAGISANVGTVAGISGNVTTVAGISGDVSTVSGNNSNVTAVATDIANVNSVAGNEANINSVAGNSTNINTVATNNTNVSTVATNIANVNTVGGSIANVNTVATNISGVNDFADRYRVASSAPTTSLDVGDLYFDTTSDTMKVYGSSGWQNAGSSVNGTSQRYHYDITGTPTSVTGVDANGNTLAYDAGYADVYVNGVRMSDADITITSGDTVTFTEALSNGDEVDIVGYGTFSVASLNADNLDSGTVPDARITGAYTGITNLTMSGDLTVDTNTLYVDSANNRVGVGTTSPDADLSLISPVYTSGGADNGIRFQNQNNSGDAIVQSYYSGTNPSALLHGANIYLSTGAAFTPFDNTKANSYILQNTNGNIEFGNTNSGTASERMRINSNGNVSIGASTSFEKLRVAGTIKIAPENQTGILAFGGTATGDLAIGVFRGAPNSTSAGNSLNLAGYDNITFSVSNDLIGSQTERARIDSSGNLLVGTSSINPADNNDASGSQLSSIGSIQASVSNATPAIFNRGNDGLIVGLLKAGVIVGSIGTLSSRLHIENGDTGLRIAGDLDQIFPCGSGGSDRDAAIDLGSSGVRFKDLYLSGGVYLGGTGSANYLDDYEEGTWTPTHGGNNMTQNGGNASYVKVGKVVTVIADVTSASGSSTTNQIGGLPFFALGPHGSAHVSYTSGSNSPAAAYVDGTILNFIQNASTTGANINASERIIFVAVYYTSA